MDQKNALIETWTSASTQSTAEHLPVSAGTLHFARKYCVIRTGLSIYNWDGKPGHSKEPREEIAHIPKSNRMPDAPHSVKVETQVVDGV